MLSEIQETEQYLEYLGRKSEEIEYRKKRILEELRMAEEEQEIIDKEALDAVRKLQVLVKRQQEELMT